MEIRSPSRAANRGGFALPAAIFALMVVALLVTAGFFLAGQEFRIGQSSERAVEARLLAESGLNETTALWRPSDVEGDFLVGDTVLLPTTTSGNGEWTVRVARVDDYVFLVESTGEVTQGGRLAGGSRTLFQMLRLPPLNIADPPGALTTEGVLEMGGNAQVDGNDSNGPSNWRTSEVCPPASGSKPGLVLDEEGEAIRNNGQPVRTADELDNNIEVAGQPDAILQDDASVNESMAVFEDENWASLVSQAHVRISRPEVAGYHRVANGNLNPGPSTLDGACHYADALNWGALADPNHPCRDYLPVIHLYGPATSGFEIQAGSSGQGILLVDGDVWVRGGFNWAGIILVNGELRTSGGGGGDPQLLGGVVAKGSELETQSLTGNSLISYSSCAIEQAMLAAQESQSLRPFANRGWVDGSAAAF